MRQYAIEQKTSPVIWVLIADGKEARIFEYQKIEREVPLGGTSKFHYSEHKSGHELMLVPDGTLNAESIDEYQIGHDRRGNAVSSVSPVQNTYEPHGNIEEELKRRFVRSIVARLDHACAEKTFNRLILTAPAKMIGELRQQLSPEAQKHVVAELPKDLGACDRHALLTHLQDTLAEAQAA